ncbi:DUF397 domain-containing protein [Streptomyces sp. ISL-43]|nr:DUF397 domain-containing protein [Streptomyces sp. ISL-43]
MPRRPAKSRPPQTRRTHPPQGPAHGTEAPPPGQAPVRDSKRTDGTVIVFPSAAWSSLVEAVRRGDLA